MKKMIGLFSMVATGFGLAQAALIVDFNPADEVSPVSVKSSVDTATSKTWEFSDTAVLFDGTAANGTVIYGGARHSVDGGSLAGSTLIISTANDRWESLADADDGQVALNTGIMLWNKADFLQAGTLSFDDTADSSFSVSVTNTLGTMGLNFVIKDSLGKYYISNLSSITGNGVYTISGADSVLWAEFDPTGLDLSPTSAYEARTFDDLQSVGFAYTGSRASLASRIHVADFQVNAVIPEPTSLSLLGVSVVSVLAFRVLHDRK